MKLIHLTDPHLVTPGEELHGLDPLDRFNAAIDSINEQHPDADLCVITGDLAHTAQTEAYVALEQSIKRLKPKCYFIMGNHDKRELLFAQFPDLQRDENGYIQFRLPTASGNFFMLDSIEKGTHQGVYCSTRRDWLKRQLEQTEDTDAFLFMHHPPFKIGLASMDAIGVRDEDADALGDLLDEFDNVRHIFFGHLHRPLSGSWRGISFSTIRATNHQVWLDFNQTDHIPGSHEPPAYAIALIEHDQIVIHTHDFMDASPKFSLGSWDYEAWLQENS